VTAAGSSASAASPADRSRTPRAGPAKGPTDESESGDWTLVICRDPAEIDATRWNALLARQPSATPFVSLEYLRALHASGSAVAETGWAPHFLLLEDAGELVAACPLYLKDHSYGEYVFDWAWADAYRRHGLEYYPKLTGAIPFTPVPGPRLLATTQEQRLLLSVVKPEQLRRVLGRMLDESEFLSSYGIRSVSRFHLEHPYELHARGMDYRLDYEPGESRTKLFGGNSNWRGPIWFPLNYLIIESLHRFHSYFGDSFQVECPTGSGRMMNLREVSLELARRLSRIFLPGDEGRRPVAGPYSIFRDDPHWRDLMLFHEYFHGDTGAGLGASHQTGWTGLVAKLLDELGQGEHYVPAGG